MGWSENLLFYLTFALYGIASLLYVSYLALRKPYLAQSGYWITVAAVTTNTAALVLRYLIAGYLPLTNGYEFLLAFSWGIAATYLIAERYYRIPLAGAFVVPVAWLILAYVAMLMDPVSRASRPLMPALQSNWLTYHVITAMVAYGAFAFSFGVGVMYLWKKSAIKSGRTTGIGAHLPSPERLDEIGYRLIAAVGFPLLTLCIITGAIWAEFAWGRYWAWDPKETWSAITWLIYAAYLHARHTFGWRGNRAAWMAIIGFMAVLFTFFGVNYFLTGLHAYAKS
ncbi:c-type cytochrome biogenesis protein CcsB [Heliophilum fasciatum]|uniref:Heme exporter protein C n=1 Tax=Heliophilum fasciatum TaxID=35700 RepID=A7UGU7_9FIRM|nr:c-type cytochrome biogenesis protein CcsB [Heliophilum fasciatum]ABU41505.1 CcsA [Heliophilum fasciatum]MCW2278465.1 cytochrome c-type biogenesis protein CcsB [Heliophilum fasciatum]TCP63596.1 cytochrome c-type biogenesis protein CcsB [Heliophilum fasciatum]